VRRFEGEEWKIGMLELWKNGIEEYETYKK
jgi:hypothetical protein